jgi:hypothetical protein
MSTRPRALLRDALAWARQRAGGDLVAFVGAIISLAATLLGAPATVIVVGALIAAGGAFWASRERAWWEHLLSAKNDEIAAMVTGGDSFCYVSLAIGDGTTDSPDVVIEHEGKYPLYDVSIQMVDLEKLRRIKTENLGTLTDARTFLHVGNLIPGYAARLGCVTYQRAETSRATTSLSHRASAPSRSGSDLNGSTVAGSQPQESRGIRKDGSPSPRAD